MGKKPIVALLTGLLLSGSAFAQSNRNRPIALLFENRPGQAVAAERKPGDAPAETQPIPASLRAMRLAILEQGVLEPLIFTLDLPTVARAVLDSKVTLPADAPPTEEQQIRIAAACGAAYVVSINYGTMTAPAGDPNNPAATQSLPTLEVEAIEVKAGKAPAAGKRWRDKIQMSDALTASQVARREGLSDSLNSAARTLVMRLSQIPGLKEIWSRTPGAPFRPRPVAPPTTPDVGEEVPPQERAAVAIKRAETILNEGHTEEGIRALRRAINLSPRSLAPRLTLIRTWEKMNRPDRVEEEALRALAVVNPTEPATMRNELVLLLGKTRQASGDLDGARESFEEVLRVDEKNSAIRLALAQILLKKGELDSAEPHFTRLLQDKPNDPEATFGLARILTLKGDFEGLQTRLSASSIDPAQRAAFVSSTFLETAMRIAARLTQNRASYDQGGLDKASFLTALQAQAKRATPLQKLLAATPPPSSTPEATRAIHKHYLLAAALLLQSLTYMQTHLEKDDNPAAAQSRVYLGEFFREMNEAASLSSQS